MLLAIDIGNSQITFGLGELEGWRAVWRLPTAAHRTTDEYAVLVGVLLELDGVEASAVDRVSLSSVVPALTPVIEAMCQRLFHLDPLVVGPGIRTGILVRYEPPGSLGSDRLVDAVAARTRYGAPVVVVDFGTATTFNVVDEAGDFVGGAIAPGVGVAAAALAAAGARLSRIDLTPPRAAGRLPLVGRNTEQSMRAGILYGYAGLVAGMLERIELALDPGRPSTVVATGGMAGVVAPLVPRIDHLVPDLILDGLRLLDGLNRDRA
jgi:type III pantothenate kinase